MTVFASALVFLACLQVRSAYAKFRQPAIFHSILRDYPFGDRLQSLGMAKLVPVFEVALAAAFLVPVPVVRLLACASFLIFIGIASGAIYFRYDHGEKRFACGCSGDLKEQMPAVALLLRNGLLLLIAAYAAVGFTRDVSALDYIGGLALLLAFDLAFAALVQEGRVRSWKGLGSLHT